MYTTRCLKNLKKRCNKAALISSALLAILPLAAGCGSSEQKEPETAKWAVYWYLCGSNLESKRGAASADIEELLQIPLKDDVKVVVQTGGSMEWKRKDVSADKLCRFVYNKKGWKKAEELDAANMGAPETFTDFLNYCKKNHPAEHSMVILWNHGGGVLGGISYDETYGMDAIAVGELGNAFAQMETDSEDKPFDIIGFDACLMANLDTAAAVSPYGDYMIASQELEPANGWNYTGLLQALAQNPDISPVELGQHICDSFMEDCQVKGTDGEATLSVLDLDKVQNLEEHYLEFGEKLLTQSLEDEQVFACNARSAKQSEQYGGNSKEEGYTNMVDLGGMIQNAVELKMEEREILGRALNDSVLYQVKGPYRKYGGGISCYYPLDNALSNLFRFNQNSDLDSYKTLYQYQLAGQLNNLSLEYLKKMGLDTAPDGTGKITVEHLGLEQHSVQMKDASTMMLNLGSGASYLSEVSGYLAKVDFEQKIMTGIGREPSENADWEQGVFTDTFRDGWWYLDGHLVYLFHPEKQDDYCLYSVPIQLNGERAFIRVAVTKDDKAKILGIRYQIGEDGIADRQLAQLNPGDEVAVCLYQALLGAEDSGLKLTEQEPFVISGEPELKKASLEDGFYAWMYDMTDYQGNYANSALVLYEVRDGKAKQIDN